jgi:pilus assembly protein FimV
MSRKLILLGVLSLILAPGAALSLGLGDIRLNSYLNQPLDAEVALSIASAAELESLQVQLASAEAFSRYGLDRPAFLDDLRFQVRRTGPSSAVVQVSSTRPIAEPFVTFLVEASWQGGRILREFTVLLDPPTFMPAPEAAPVPAAAVDAPQPAPAARAEPAPAPVARPVPAPAPVVTPTPVQSEYGAEFGPVQRNDTLWAIAQRVRPDPGLSTNQVMVALFRANPHAFNGNINRLRAGVILRVPSRSEMAAASGREATAEVRRQNEAWRGAAAPVAERRLELAPPAATPPAAPAADPVRDATGVPPALAEAVDELRGELAETRRLLDVKDAEIAALQSRLAELESEAVPVAELPTAPVERPAVEAAPEEAPAEAVAPEAEPVAEPEPEAAPTPAPVPAAPAPTLMDRVMAMLGSLWLWLVLAAVLIAAAIVVFLRKRSNDERSIEEDLAQTGTWGTLEGSAPRAGAAAAGAAALKVQPRARPEDDLESILVEETEAPARPKAGASAPMPAPTPAAPQPETRQDEDYHYPFEDTIAGETGVNLDQADPMAEADFHMAYGLYDQAAEIIKKAVEREPDRYDLRRKLLDICFVWGNAEEFLAQAKAVRQMGGEAQVADWAKVAIMGRQICPGETMFTAEGVASVDVDFDSDEVNLPAMDQDTSTSGEWLDFDVGQSDEPIAALGDTREQPAPAVRPGIEQTAELDLEELGIDLDLGESGEHALRDLGDLGDELPGEEDEAGGTQVMDAGALPKEGDDATQRGEGLGESEDEPTLSGATAWDIGEADDPTLAHRVVTPEEAEEAGEVPTLSGLDALSDEGDDDEGTLITPLRAADDSETAEVEGVDEDLDLDDFTQMLESGLATGEEEGAADDKDKTQLSRSPDDDEDVTMMAPGLGSQHDEAEDDDGTTVAPIETAAGEPAYQEGDTREMPPVDIDIDDMNEIGTKLDLARAYIDMGDPEGARSILEEVVEEGDEAQRDEARELLDSLD